MARDKADFVAQSPGRRRHHHRFARLHGEGAEPDQGLAAGDPRRPGHEIRHGDGLAAGDVDRPFRRRTEQGDEGGGGVLGMDEVALLQAGAEADLLAPRDAVEQPAEQPAAFLERAVGKEDSAPGKREVEAGRRLFRAGR
jgi:hypothetical protein